MVRKTKKVEEKKPKRKVSLVKLRKKVKKEVKERPIWFEVKEQKISDFEISLKDETKELELELQKKKIIEDDEGGEDKKEELIRLLEILDERKKKYWIMDAKMQEHQQQAVDCLSEKYWTLPKNKFILFQWWNGAWKTALLVYIVVLLALWKEWKKYWLPYIWEKKNMRLVTKSSSNVSWTFQPYLLWDYSPFRIPPEEVVRVIQDNWVAKKIILKNWCIIEIKTYDQWRERVQGWNPDFVWVDEEPTDKWVWEELLARGRWSSTQIFISMTPLSWLTPVYSFFYEWEKQEVERRKVFVVSSLENKHADHTWLMMLSEEDRKMRIYWQFVPPTWLVYKAFNRKVNVVKHFHPKELWDWVRYYWWLDLWVVHPTWFVLLAVDLDDNIYIFDWFKRAWLYLDEIKKLIDWLIRKYNIKLEYIIADSAAKRERHELAKLWLKTLPADKWSKWENNESNRKTGILKINTLFHNSKLFISDELTPLIDELEKHAYKWWNKDWEVIKENDDIIDAMRYIIFSIKKNDVKWIKQREYENKYNTKYNKINYNPNKYKKVY